MENTDTKIRKPRKKKDEIEAMLPVVFTSKNIRDYNGFVEGIDYIKDEYGFVNWKKHIKEEHIVLNKSVYAKEGIDVNTLSPEQISEYKKTATEDRLLIKLSGFRDIARLRGIKEARPKITWLDNLGIVVCDYVITWIGNSETNFQEVSYGAVASASADTVSSLYKPFLEAIACNRAFCRVVRESLCIHVVGAEEANPNEVVEVSNALSPKKYLENICESKKIKLETVIKFLAGAGLTVGDWTSFSQIPDKTAISALELIKTNG